MRSIKTSGGLTRGRGFGDTQRTSWLLSAPACAEVISKMRQLADLEPSDDITHKESSASRKSTNHNDLRALLSYILQRNLFMMTNVTAFLVSALVKLPTLV